MPKRKNSAGGAALHGGAAYQNRVAAWIAVEMLSERSAEPLTTGGSVVFLQGETREDVDDLLVGTSLGRYAFLQAKRQLSLSELEKSEFGSFIDQAVCQFTASRLGLGRQPWSRQLGPEDRIVLVTSSASTKEIREALRDVLRRILNLAPGQTLDSAAVNARERKVLKTAIVQAKRFWKAATSNTPDEAEIREFLALLSVEVLDVDGHEINVREAERTLEQVVLQKPVQSGGAWSTIVDACTEMAQNRSGLDLASFQEKLRRNDIGIRSLRSFRDDIERLRAHTSLTTGWLRELCKIEFGGAPIHLERRVIQELRTAIEKASNIVVGQPGAGKSGALYDLVQRLQKEGRDVVCLATDRLEISSLFTLRTEIGLEHDLPEVLKNWQGEGPGYLVIDAMDAARGAPAEQAMLSLIRAVAGPNTRWRVVAAIRKFDLPYSVELQKLFPHRTTTEAASEFVDREFSSVQHVNIPCLATDEIESLEIRAPDLYRLYRSASEDLRQLLRVPFNLRLAADLLDSGLQNEELAPLRTQLELLNKYWSRRVLQTYGGDDREAILRRAVQNMVQSRSLKTDREGVRGSSPAPALEQLLSNHVLTEWQPSPTSQPDRYALAFAHNLLFDFAVRQLFLPRAPEDLEVLLANDPDLVLVIRPSIVFFCQDRWEQYRTQFWDMAFSFCTSQSLSQLAQSVPLYVVAFNAHTIDDIRPLISALCSRRAGAERAFQHLVGILRSRSTLPRPLTAGPWSEFVDAVSRCLSEQTIAHAQAAVESLLQEEELTFEQRKLVGDAARRILVGAWHGV